MAKTAMKIKQQRKQKFSTREYSRCRICGRPHAYSIQRPDPGSEKSQLVGRKQLNEPKRLRAGQI